MGFAPRSSLCKAAAHALTDAPPPAARASGQRLTLLGGQAANESQRGGLDLEERLRTYREALRATTDAQWRYQMAEGDAHRAAARHIEQLWALQVDLDPKGFIWRANAPEGFAIPLPRVLRAAS